MIRRITLRLLIWAFKKQNREISKITIDEEFEYLKFDKPENVKKLLQLITTMSLLRHWEAVGDYERGLIKGYGMMAQMLINGHRKVFEIEAKIENHDHRIKKWKLIRFNIFAGLLSRQPK